LPTLGGQTGLNLAVALADAGVLDRYNVALLGTPLSTIRQAEDRALFRQLLLDIGEPVPEGVTVHSMEEAREAANGMGLPLVVRPAYTLGGTGGGIATTPEELESIVSSGLAASPIDQVLLERSLVGWKELEYEVMRDGADNCITVCVMENIDPMGVHTGDSIVVAPSQTLTDKEYQMLRSASLKIIRALGIEGGCNIQFALAPHPWVAPELYEDGRVPDPSYYVIEVNPRVSRSSALASKATGYPIARVAAKIAAGRRLDEIPNAVTGKTLAAFEPTLDYCVVKIPRWPFDKFASGDRSLGTQMKATGEVMAIDRTLEAALQKAVRSLELGDRSLLWQDPAWGQNDSDAILEDLPLYPNDLRIWALMAALRRNISIRDLARITGIEPWYLSVLQNIVDMERRLLSETLTPRLLWQAKRLGFSDEQIGTLADRLPEQVRNLRTDWNIRPAYKMVDTCAAEFEAETPYFYSTYERENEAKPLPHPKALVIGSGPIRIGQGIEFDYCSVHAAWALQEDGTKSIIVNSNPETVSTDFDTSDRLYFEPLDEESILDILHNEGMDQTDGEPAPPPSVVQFGGQTAINLSQALDRAGMPVMGSSAEAIDIASDRRRFEDFLSRLGVPQPPGAAVVTVEEALNVAQRIGYPVLMRPSYVLGGRAMEIIQNPTELVRYHTAAADVLQGRPVLIDKYLAGREVEVDAVCDGERVLIPGIMEHVERAGVHSGDSMAIYPGLTLTEAEVATLVDYTTQIGLAIQIRGLINIQFVIVGPDAYREPTSFRQNTPGGRESEIYVLEANPRASRTIPFISKVTGVPMVYLATKVIQGGSLRELGYEGGLWPSKGLVGVKAPVFSMSKLLGVDTYLGPEMKSTGEVMGVDKTFGAAVAKALAAGGLMLPQSGSILLSLADKDKADAVPLVTGLAKANYKLYATEGTAVMIRALGLDVTPITKRLGEGHPNVVDVINDRTVDAVVNTISPSTAIIRDGFYIRRTAVERGIPCYTSIDTARAAVESVLHGPSVYNVLPMAEYLRGDGSGDTSSQP
ncbi:MAG: carbamoyl-phosphate synthase large subunit, partial [Chloroflexi bacterium]|nr:carbamoyl-phosphate synthase large subunit [Chloroflexota bacterium]